MGFSGAGLASAVSQGVDPLGIDGPINDAGGILDGIGGALAHAGAAAGAQQGPIRKTYTRGGQLYYVGGGKVPAGVVRQIKLRQQRAKKAQQAALKKRGKATPSRSPAGRGGAGAGAAVSGSSSESSPLGDFGAPDERNVSRIVNSIINDATNQYRWAAQDARKRAQADLLNVGRGALAVDQLSQVSAAANKHATDQFLTKSTEAAQQERDFMNQYRAQLEDTSQTGGVPLEYQVADADQMGAAAGAQVEGQQIGAANQAFFDMQRAANSVSAQDAGRNIRSAYAQELQQNQRAIAAERSKRALYEQQIRKDLMDQHIARKMAEAEFSQRGSSLLNDKSSRAAQSAQLEQAKAERSYKDYEILNSILLGTGETIEVPTGKADKNGKPIMVKQVVPMGQASTWNEALRRIRVAGLGSKQNILQAQQLWAELNQQKLAAGLSGVSQGIGNFFPGV